MSVKLRLSLLAEAFGSWGIKTRNINKCTCGCSAGDAMAIVTSLHFLPTLQSLIIPIFLHMPKSGSNCFIFAQLLGVKRTA